MVRIFTVFLVLCVSFFSIPSQAKYIDAKLSELHRAVFYGKLDVVEFLVQSGEDVNIRAGNDNTPLHMAAYKGKTEVFKLLLRLGADMRIKNARGQTAFDIAKKKEFTEIVKFVEAQK